MNYKFKRFKITSIQNNCFLNFKLKKFSENLNKDKEIIIDEQELKKYYEKNEFFDKNYELLQNEKKYNQNLIKELYEKSHNNHNS